MATKAKAVSKKLVRIDTDEFERLSQTNELRAKVINNLQATVSQLQEDNIRLNAELDSLKSKAASRHWLLRKLGL